MALPIPASRPSSQALEIPDYLSPEISTDGRITLRYFHPGASEVWCEADWNDWRPVALNRERDGLWSCTSGPLPPDLYEYALFADGARVIDYQNPEIKNRFTYFANVPGTIPGIHEERDLPHGSVHIHWYHSPITGGVRRMHVYTPPGYETGSDSYPLCILLHGAGDDDAAWIRIGRANFILDNLLAEGTARPMILAMPDGHFFGSTWKEQRGTKLRAFAADLFQCAIPEIERLYRLRAGRESRALAGLSMGGGQTIFAGLTRPESFGAFGIFSSGLWPEVTPALEQALPMLRDNPPRLLWIGIGRRDFLYNHCSALRKMLSVAGIPFFYHEDDTAHSWRAWRRYLALFAPLLFAES